MKHILISVCHYQPGYKAGGALRAIANIVERLGEEYSFSIITRDRDLGESKTYIDIERDSWTEHERCRIYYVSPAKQNLRQMSRVISELPYDCLYLNSFFDPVFSIRLLIARKLGMLPQKPIILACRGEFSRDALSLKSLKKSVYLWLAKVTGLLKGLTWQGTSADEIERIRVVIGAQAKDIRYAPDLPPVVSPRELRREWKAREVSAPLRIVCVSRIAVIKNISYALEVLNRLSIPVSFDVYGPVEDAGYMEVCKSICEQLSDDITVTFHGSVPYQDLMQALVAYDLFFLPSRSENFGHAILESLLTGTPVLISKNTPWRDLQTKGIGWDIDLAQPEEFVSAIEKACSYTSSEYAEWRNRVKQFAIDLDKNDEEQAMTRQLFELARA